MSSFTYWFPLVFKSRFLWLQQRAHLTSLILILLVLSSISCASELSVNLREPNSPAELESAKIQNQKIAQAQIGSRSTSQSSSGSKANDSSINDSNAYDQDSSRFKTSAAAESSRSPENPEYPEKNDKKQSPIFAKKGWLVSPTIFYSAARLLRGATIWPEPSGMIVPGLAYADWFRLSQGGVQVYQKLEYFEYATGLSYIDDAQPMFSFTKHKSDFRNERDPTYELVAGAKAFSKYKHEVSLSVHQDLKVHHGQYVIMGVNFPLLPLTSLNFSYAMADERHNHYIYGEGAVGGAAHFDISGRLLLPFLPGGGILILSWLRSQILQEQNRMASYVNGENPNGSFSALATWTL